MPFWALCLVFIGTSILSALLQKRPQSAKPSSLGEFSVPTADAGRTIPYVCGTVKIGGGNVTWFGDYEARAMVTKAGGFFGIGAKSVTTGYKYYIGMQMVLCHGPVDAVQQVWAGNKLAPMTLATIGSPENYQQITIHAPGLFGGDQSEGGLDGIGNFYRGITTQLSDAYLSAQLGVTAPAYQGLCHVVMPHWYMGTSNYIKTLAWIVSRFPNQLGLGSNQHIIATKAFGAVFAGTGNGTITTAMGSAPVTQKFTAVLGGGGWAITGSVSGAIGTATTGVAFTSGPVNLTITAGTVAFQIGDNFTFSLDAYSDANPACVIYDLLTSTRYGLGVPTALIDTAAFQAVGTVLFNESNGISIQVDNASAADQILGAILQQINGILYTDPSSGLWELSLIRNDYTVGSLTEFTQDDIGGASQEAPSFSRVALTETVNEIKLSYVSRSANFQQAIAQSQDIGNFSIRNELVSSTVEYHGVSNAALAQAIADRDLRTLSYPIAQIKFKASRKAWALRPGKPFKFTFAPYGITGLICRVTEINYGAIENGEIEISAIEDIFNVAAAAYSSPGVTGWTDPFGPPVAPTAQTLFEVPYQLVAGPSRFVAALVVRADSTSTSYDIWESDAGGAYYKANTSFAFTPSGLLLNAYSAATAATDSTGFILSTTGAQDLTHLSSTDSGGLSRGVNIALIDSELISWQTITANGDGTYTISGVMRGVLDTLPANHSSGARVYFITDGNGATNGGNAFTSDLTVAVKCLPTNPRGVLPIGSATLSSLATASRVLKPLPPGNVQIQSFAYPTFPVTTVGNAALTWSHRNRISQTSAGTMVAQDYAGTYSPEGIVRVEVSVGGTLKRTYDTTGTNIPSGAPGVGNLNGLAMKDTNTWIIPTSNDQTNPPSRLISISTAGIANYAGDPSSVGQVDGSSTTARFQGSSRSVIDGSGNVLTIDKQAIIRKTNSSQVTSTYVDLSSFGTITSIAIDGSGNLYAFADTQRVILKVTPAFVVSVLAGNPGTSSGIRNDGTGSAASFSQGCMIACDSSGNIFVQEFWGGGTTLGTLRYCTSAGVVTTLVSSSGEYVQQMAVIGSDVYMAGFFDRMTSPVFAVRKFTPAGVMTQLMTYIPGTFGTIQQLAPDPGGFLAFAGLTTSGSPMVGRITSGGVASVVYFWPGGGWYGALDRIADDPDGTKTVVFVLTPINGSYSGQARTLPAITMTGLGMTLGNYLGGIQA